MYLSGLGQGQPYYTKGGQPTQSAAVGDVIGYEVPGVSEIWLEQTQNGGLQYSGPFTVPMAPYTLLARDAGSFQSAAYTLMPNKTRGQLIGTAVMNVAPIAIAAPLPKLPAPVPVVLEAPPMQLPTMLAPPAGGPVDFGPDPGATAPPAESENYTPYILAGAGILAAVAFMSRGRR